MRDTSQDDGKGGGPAPHVTLIGIGETYWLYSGEEFLTPLLSGDGFVPLPIHCYIYTDLVELRLHLGREILMTDYWGINPDVVDRLRRENHLLEIRGQSPNSE
ncbi:MAG: hypothetical protein WCD16_06950 [Paracoccaceae bacterium]